MAWKVNIDRHAIKQLKKLDSSIQKRIVSFMKDHLDGSDNPRKTGKALQGTLSGLWRYRVGNYRIICQLQDQIVTVLVLNIQHRKSVYKN